MYSALSPQSFYLRLRLFDLLHPASGRIQHRAVSTTSAIKKSLCGNRDPSSSPSDRRDGVRTPTYTPTNRDSSSSYSDRRDRARTSGYTSAKRDPSSSYSDRRDRPGTQPDAPATRDRSSSFSAGRDRSRSQHNAPASRDRPSFPSRDRRDGARTPSYTPADRDPSSSYLNRRDKPRSRDDAPTNRNAYTSPSDRRDRYSKHDNALTDRRDRAGGVRSYAAGPDPRSAQPESRTRDATETSEDQDDVWNDIRRIGELVEGIQTAENANPDVRPQAMISEAKGTIDKLNEQLQLLGASEQRRERVFYLQRRLQGLNAYAKERHGEKVQAEKTVVLENKGGNSFELVVRGQTMSIVFQATKHAETFEKPRQNHSNITALVPKDEARIKKDITRIRLLLDDIRTLQSHNPDAPPPRNATAEIHRLLRSIDAFGDLSARLWRGNHAKLFNTILRGNEDEHAYYDRRVGEAEKLMELTSRSEPRFKLVFDKQGLRDIELGGTARSNERLDADENLDAARAEEAKADVRRIRVLIQTIQSIEDSSSEPSTSPSAKDELIVEVKTLVQKINALARESPKVDQLISKRFHNSMGGLKELYAKKGVEPDGSRTMLRKMEDGVHEVVLKGQIHARDVGSESVEHNRDESRARDDRRDVGDTTSSLGLPSRTTRPDDPAGRFSFQKQRADDDRDIPLSIPYTTAASEFLYGSNVVLAALRAKRRKLYHLYLSPRAYSRDTGNAQQIIDLARRSGVAVSQDANMRLLDKMSDSRPHNGVILEASRLPAPPVLSLASPDPESSDISLTLDRQSAEDAAVNGTSTAISSTTSRSWRQPFIVMLDGITDPGNLGNILRTAHFYSVDAVAVATNTCAPLSSAVLAKASSGACEAVRILALPKPAHFVAESRKEGWKIYAAVAPPSRSDPGFAQDAKKQSTTTAVAANSPLSKDPVILMLGAEGEGLRANLTSKADVLLSIEQGSKGRGTVDVGVDSLNVGVAAGVLMEALLRKPVEAAGGSKAGEEAAESGELGF